MDLKKLRKAAIARMDALMAHKSDGTPDYEATEWSDEKAATYKAAMNEIRHIDARLAAREPAPAAAAHTINPMQGESILQGERATEIKRAFQPIAEQIVAAGRGESQMAQTVSGSNKGGETVPVEVDAGIEVALAVDAPMITLATVTPRDSGRTLNVPVLDASAIRGEARSEATSPGAASDLSFSVVALPSELFASQYHEISKPLDQDSAVDMVGELAAIHTSALMRGVSDALTTGAGGTSVTGVLESTSVTNAVTSATATALTHAEIVGLIGSLPERARRRAVLQFNQSTETALAQILYGADKVPIIMRDPAGGITGTGGGTFHALGLGPVPYLLNPALDSMATKKVPILYGDMSRQRMLTAPNLNGHSGIEIVVLRDSAFELKNTYGIFARWRVAGKFVSAAAGHDARKITMK